MRLHHAALLLALMVAWGVNFPIAKLGLQELPPLLMTTLRFALTAILLMPFARWPRGRALQIAGLSFTFGVVHMNLLFAGMRHIDGGAAAIAVQVQVPFAALIAALFYNDPLGWRRALGMTLAIAGLFVVAGAPRLEGQLLPFLLVVLSAIIWAITNIQAKHLRDVSAATITAYVALFGVPQMLATSLLLEDGQIEALSRLTLQAILAVLYLSVVVTILGYAVWYRMVQRYPINTVMPFTLLIPIIGVVASAVALDEPLTWHTAIGGAATIVGVAIVIIRAAPRRTPQ